ncbi:glycoside hydrolase superfamily [Neocallimastix sp. 'constans']
MVGIQPQQGKYNFDACDRHYNKAKELGMAFRGHCLIWHSMPPQWFQNLKGDALKNAIVDHINKTLKYYEGKIDTWDVVNEAIDDSSNGPQWKMRPSFLYQNVPDFVDLAFKTARAATSTTKLFYNDYNTEGVYGKTEAVFNFVKDMKTRGIPIDGVGLQYHVTTQAYPKYDKINDLIGRYCQLGLEVHITEMDVKSGGNAQAQASVYSDALKACLNNSCCTAFLVWGVGDNDSWLGANEAGLLFDGSYQPKAAYTALLQTLGGGRAGGNSAPAPSPAPAGNNQQAPANNQTQQPPAGNNQQPPANNQPQQPPANNNPWGGNQQQPQQPPANNNPWGGNQQQPQQPPANNNPWGGNQQQPQWNQWGGNQQQPQQPPANNNPWGGNNNQWNPWGNNAAPVNAAAAPAAGNGGNGGNCAGAWAQCGGQGFNGPKCCSQGTCKAINEYYSQCAL